MAKRSVSNGAREAMLKVMAGRAQLADAILACLWMEGYKLVPLTSEDLK